METILAQPERLTSTVFPISTVRGTANQRQRKINSTPDSETYPEPNKLFLAPGNPFGN